MGLSDACGDFVLDWRDAKGDPRACEQAIADFTERVDHYAGREHKYHPAMIAMLRFAIADARAPDRDQAAIGLLVGTAELIRQYLFTPPGRAPDLRTMVDMRFVLPMFVSGPDQAGDLRTMVDMRFPAERQATGWRVRLRELLAKLGGGSPRRP